MFPTRSIFIAAALTTSVMTASAASIDVPSGTYQSDPFHTNLLWSVTHFGLSHYYGRFDGINAKLDLNADDVSKSKLTVTVDPKSVDVNYPGDPKKFSDEIAGTKFFDAAQYPLITFTSTEIALTGEKTGTVTGDLTFHGVTKPVTLNVTLNNAYKSHPMSKKPTIGFSATTTFKRSDFGVNTLVGPISDEVNLIIETEFSPTTEPTSGK